MRILREWAHRLLGTLRRGRSDDDLEEELRLHRDLATDSARRRGRPPDQAERAATLGAGVVPHAMEALRDQRGLRWLDESAQDLRYALRVLGRSPAFTTVALLTLALGIGSNTAIYQLVDAVRLRLLPVSAPEQLAIVELADLTRWKGRRTTGYPALTNPLWEEIRANHPMFSDVLAWSAADFRLGREAGSEVARGLFVSGGFFHTLDVEPLAGRVFEASDDRPGCGLPGAVLSYGFWQRRFGGDPAAIGGTVTLNSQPVEVIGVTPPGFTGIEVGRSYDVAVPVCSQESLGRERGWLASRTTWWLTVMGRMPRTGRLDQTSARLDALSPGLFEATAPRGWSSEDAADYLRLRLRAAPGAAGVSTLRRRYGDPLLVLLATAGLVWLIACTNLANLVLARASAREREFALRLAVGASRSRIVRQMIVESALLASGGAAAGAAFAMAATRLLVRHLGAGLSLDLAFDGGSIAFVVLAACLTCLAFGAVPAWRVSRIEVQDAVRAGGRSLSASPRTVGLRQVLVMAQVSLSLVLLVGALLFAATLRNLLAVDTGFDADNVQVARLDLSRTETTPEGRRAFTRELLDRVRSSAGIESAAEVRHVPLGGTGSSLTVWRDGADGAAGTVVRLNAMSDGYLRTMGIGLIAGRDFDVRDSETSPRVAIVNRSFARRLGLDRHPVGERVRADLSFEPAAVFEIVGLVPDTKYFSLREDPLPIAFVPMAQIDDPRSFTDFVVRSTLPAAGAAAAVREAVAEEASLVDVDVRPFDSTIRDQLQRERLLATLSGFFGLLGALIAAIGLYGVMSYVVVRRTGEIGVRLALGATRRDILAMVLRQAATLVGLGLAAGSLLALAAGRSVRSLVFGLQPQDVKTLGLACAALGAVALAASLLPARRAARLDPLAALREE